MTFEIWLAFCATTTVLCFVPGPAVLFVGSVALARGVRAGLEATFGILVANVLYFALSATGVATVAASDRMFVALQGAGAAYLCWLGGHMLVRPAAVSVPPAPRAVSDALARGFVVQATNPAALAYFAALLPQFVDPHARVAWQVFVLGASATVIELAVLALYVQAAGRARTFAGARAGRTFERVGGAVLLVIGLRLALARLG